MVEMVCRCQRCVHTGCREVVAPRNRARETYRIQVTVPLVRELQPLAFHTLVRMQVEQPTLQSWDPTVLRDFNPREAVDRMHSYLHRGQLLLGDQIRFVDHDGVRVADLQVRGRQRRMVPACRLLPVDGTRLLRRRLVQAPENVLRVNQRDDPVQVDGTAEALVDPEERRDIARVGETGGLEEDVVKGSTPLHEGLDGIDARVLDAAADAAVGQLQPFFHLLAGLVHREGLFNVRSFEIVSSLISQDVPST